jgi:hypothetical protein
MFRRSFRENRASKIYRVVGLWTRAGEEDVAFPTLREVELDSGGAGLEWPLYSAANAAKPRFWPAGRIRPGDLCRIFPVRFWTPRDAGVAK